MHFSTTLIATLAFALVAPAVEASRNSNVALLRARAVAPVLFPTPAVASPTATHRRHHAKSKHGKTHTSSHKTKKGAKKGKRQDGSLATVKCDSLTTWSLCGNGVCTPMGPVAEGTVCVDGAIALPASGGAAPVAAPATPAAASDPAPAVEPSAASVKSAPVVLAADRNPVSSSSSQEAATTSADEPAPTAEAIKPIVAVAAIVPSVVAAIVPSVTVLPLPSSTPAPAPSPAPASNGANGPFTGGKATFYNQEGGFGACGKKFTDSDRIIALQLSRYGSGSNNAPDCGRQVTIKNNANGKTTQAVVADACPGCANFNSIDLSVAAFNDIADPATGVIDITWSFI